MENSSYVDKIDTRFFMLMFALSYLPEESGMVEGGSLAMLPELYEKYEEEGCPDWTSMYGSKIKTNKIWSIFFEAYPPNFLDELREISDLKLEKYFDRFIEICNKYDEELSKFGELIYEGIKRKKITVLLSAYVLKNIIVCPALFGVNFSELLQKAKKGDHESIFKLIQIDKSFIGTRWVLKEIRKAQLSGNFEFLDKLGKNLRKDAWSSNKNKKENIGQRLVLVLGWNLGLNKLTHPEIHDLLTDLGVCKYEDTDSLSHELKKLNLRTIKSIEQTTNKTKKAVKKTIKKTKKATRRKSA
jgi:hypothetical protein